MGDESRQAQESVFKRVESEARGPKEERTRLRPGRSAGPRSAMLGPNLYRGALIFILLGFCALQGLVLKGITQGRIDSKAVASQIKTMQSEVAGLQSFMDETITEDLIFLKILVLNPKTPTETARSIACAVSKYSRRYNRDPDLILSIMKVESAFDPAAVSKMGAIGLMQVMPQWIGILDIACDLQDPDCNVKYGLQIMGAYEQLYVDPDMALTAYNRGPGPVDSALMQGKNPDNGYVDMVRAVYARLQELGRSKRQIQLAIK